MSILVVGVGGVGRGVCNWLKHRLEHEYGSAAAAGFSMLVIDGPGEDDNQYKLPDGFQIDVSPQSTEFYQLEQRPGPAIVDIQAGRSHPYIDRWLGRSEAQKISNPNGIIPETGYGQVRPAGRVGFFLESSDLAPRLRALVQGQDFIVMIGSQSGGTGSGMLLDVAQILRKEKPPSTPFHAYVALPNGFRAIFGDDQSRGQGNARGFAGMRELERLFMKPGHVDYCPGTSVSNSELFDGCFIIDGEGRGGVNLNGKAPLFGVCPALADHLLCTYGTGVAGTSAANWRQHCTVQVPGGPSEPGYMVPGIYTYLYDWKALETSFAFGFAREIYDRLLTVPPDEADKGRQRAEAALRTTGPGTLSLTVATAGGLPVRWPELNQPDSLEGLVTLRRNLNTNGPANAEGPRPPYATVVDWLDLSRIFRPVPNQDVVSQCHGFTAQTVGQQTDTPDPGHDATLWAWINYQRAGICRDFIVQLAHQLLELFYDTQQGKWRTLEQRPYSLVIARDVLLSCRKLLDAELAEVRAWLNRFADEKVMQRAEGVLKGEEENLLSQPPSRGNQAVFVEGPYQWYHTLVEWHTLLQAYELTLADMLALTNDLWMKVGETADGWIGYLQACREQMQTASEKDLTFRQEYAKALPRCYLPDPGGPTERQLYVSLVTDSGIIGALLGQMQWQFHSQFRSGGGLAFGTTVGADGIATSFDCFLVCPDVPGYDPPDQLRQWLADGVSGSYRKTLTYRHKPELFVQDGRNKCGGPLATKDIWEIAALEATARGRDLQQFGDEMAASLVSKSEPALLLVGDATPTEESFGAYIPSAASALPVAVNAALTANQIRPAGVAAGSPFRYSVAVARVAARLRLPEWEYYPRTRSDYYEWRGGLPCHCHAEERNATDYVEEFLLAGHVVQESQLPLHPSVCRHLGNWEAFQSFAVCFALLGTSLSVEYPLADTGGGVAARRLQIPDCQTGAGPQAVCDLGLACNLDGALTALMADTPLAQSARSRLITFCREDLPRYLAIDPSASPAVEAAMRPQSPAAVALPPLDTTSTGPEGLNRTHLQWAIWAACWQYCNGVLGI
ncbi:tubulin-like doman-containing protein [bacterium]|nr:tubulin-like doman-containing protein [bacterium]